MSCYLVWKGIRIFLLQQFVPNYISHFIFFHLFCELIRLKYHFGSAGYPGSLLLLWLVGTPPCCKGGLSPPTGFTDGVPIGYCTVHMERVSPESVQTTSSKSMVTAMHVQLGVIKRQMAYHPLLLDYLITLKAWSASGRGGGLGCSITCCFDYFKAGGSSESVCYQVTNTVWARQHFVLPSPKSKWPQSLFPQVERMFTYSLDLLQMLCFIIQQSVFRYSRCCITALHTLMFFTMFSFTKLCMFKL